MGGGGKVPYPKHVWSPAGGWYGQPKNWKTNTALSMVAIAGIAIMTARLGAEREEWHHLPEPEKFAPSRYWNNQLSQLEKERKASQGQ